MSVDSEVTERVSRESANAEAICDSWHMNKRPRTGQTNLSECAGFTFECG